MPKQFDEEYRIFVIKLQEIVVNDIVFYKAYKTLRFPQIMIIQQSLSYSNWKYIKN